ncbi:MAG: cupin domain-containing protein [Solirubrobacterales bacterium]|nr:cupin domain-containing protein [Solirubrobacterales bacterium]
MTYTPHEGPPETELQQTETGKRAAGPGWFVVNAREAPWERLEGGGQATLLEPKQHRFEQLGVNVHVLSPGEPSTKYHGESAQEGFLVISGECTLLVEGAERTLRAWDFFHCPAWTHHAIVGAGDGPCAIVMIGHRPDEEIDYPADPAAASYGAAADPPTNSGREAYADWPESAEVAYQEGWLPQVNRG